jgi:alkylation response protein AidB-like acyl-CoA dehydrogenase
MTTSLLLDRRAILANANAIQAILCEEIEEAERRRQLTPRIVEALRSAGVFRMPMPAAWGGPEVDIISQIEIVEAVSRGYASAGWCAMIGSDGGFFSASLEDQVGRRLFADLDSITAGMLQPRGCLDIVDDGFLLSGHWSFGSGCTHADVICSGAAVFKDGQPVLQSDGKPEWRIALLAAAEFTILDSWHTTGLARSGSHDYTIEQAFVPREQTFRFGEVKRSGALYAWPGLLLANVYGVPLGIAENALDTATATLATKLILPERKLARDEPRVRTAIARARALYSFSMKLWAQRPCTATAHSIDTCEIS